MILYDKIHRRYMKDIYCNNKWLATRVGDGGYANVFNYAYDNYFKEMPRWTMMYLVFKLVTPEEAFDIFHNMVYYYLQLK